MTIPIFIPLLVAIVFDLVKAMPSQTEYGGQNCPGSCVQSYSCDPRCAPVSNGASGSVLRWCTSSSSNSNSECCCGCTTVLVASQPSYFWYNYDNMTCSNSCPPGFYPPTSGSGYSCYPCNSWCLTCTGSSQNQCLTCNTGSYQLNSTACYAYTTAQNPGLTSRFNPCPNGFYGLQITKVCVACPTVQYVPSNSSEKCPMAQSSALLIPTITKTTSTVLDTETPSADTHSNVINAYLLDILLSMGSALPITNVFSTLSIIHQQEDPFLQAIATALQDSLRFSLGFARSVA